MQRLIEKPRLMRLLTLITIGILMVGCATFEQSGPKNPPNIVWITSEDNSKHYLKLFDPNGVSTPNIASLLTNGLQFTHAFSNAPVCSVARSTLISGCYGPRVGIQFHRKVVQVPLPDSLKMFPAYLREAGYYTSNNRKEDYNFIKPPGVWDESSNEASWKNRTEDQPFFHVQNIHTTHEGRLHFDTELMDTFSLSPQIESFDLLPQHPDTEIFRFTNAYYRHKILQMDEELGRIVDELREEDLLDNTFVFYFADHGGVLPGSKGYINETGLHVPLVVHIPKDFEHLVDLKPGNQVSDFVSFVDFGPTVLHLAGLPVPEGMDGKPFMGKDIAMNVTNDDVTYGYADRMDEKYDMVRSVREGRYKLIRNYQPYQFDGLMNNYRYRQMAFKEWEDLYEGGHLNSVQMAFFEPKAPVMLYDLEVDPYETSNLVDDPEFQDVYQRLLTRLDDWILGMPDLSFFPEHALINKAFSDPTNFGQNESARIGEMKKTADLVLHPFTEIEQEIEAALASTDPWIRYWALIVCTTFGRQAIDFYEDIKYLALNDEEAVNRARAGEFIAAIGLEDPSNVMRQALIRSKDGTEALLILNSIVLLKDGPSELDIRIDAKDLSSEVLNHSEVKRRLTYLNII